MQRGGKVDEKSGAPPAKTTGELFIKKVELSKLATHEDPYHVHKTLGVLSVLHFIYRYTFVLPTTGTLGFEGTMFDWITMTMHLALASSSMIFHVLKHRKLRFPMLMWNEYRLHAIVFTLRCWSVFAFGYACATIPWLQQLINTPPGRAICFAVPLLHHCLADLITHWYGTPGITSVRVGKSKRTGKVKYSAVKKFYSFYQFIAIASHITPNGRDMDLGFNTLIAIQSSAFLMTLCRKNIITFRCHGIVYTSCLVLSAGYMVYTMCAASVLGGLFLVAATLATFAVRVTFRTNKYLLWALFTALTFPGAPALAWVHLSGLSAAGAPTLGVGSLGGFGFAVLLWLLSGRSDNGNSSGSSNSGNRSRTSSGSGSGIEGLTSVSQSVLHVLGVGNLHLGKDGGGVGVADIIKGGS